MTYKNNAELIDDSKRMQVVEIGFNDLMPKDLKAEVLGEAIETCEDTSAKVKETKASYNAAMDADKKAFRTLKTLRKRVRSSVKGIFGDDSLEYEGVGGKRISDRKRPTKKAKSAAK
jgi:hypothetical protein